MAKKDASHLPPGRLEAYERLVATVPGLERKGASLPYVHFRAPRDPSLCARHDDEGVRQRARGARGRRRRPPTVVRGELCLRRLAEAEADQSAACRTSAGDRLGVLTLARSTVIVGRMPDDQGYSITELAALAGTTPRTVRYYVSTGLLPSPAQAGPATRYGDAHLRRLRLIRRLQGEHLPLAEIRSRLDGLDDDRGRGGPGRALVRCVGWVGARLHPRADAVQRRGASGPRADARDPIDPDAVEPPGPRPLPVGARRDRTRRRDPTSVAP